MKRSILIVESTFFIRSLLKKTLEGIPDLAVADLYDSNEAKMELARQAVDLVVLDLNLHGEDGLDFLGELKKVYPETAVIVLSSKNSRLKEAEEAKADASLPIPVDLEQLKATIVKILKIG
jgi:DNA-binding NarL/FixJ family response regulator